MNKKQIMTRAWEIARAGVDQFGGKTSEYLSEALKLAWEQSKDYKVDKMLEIVADRETGKTSVYMIENGRTKKSEENLNNRIAMEKMADYASSLGYKTMDHFFLIDNKRVYRGRQVA